MSEPIIEQSINQEDRLRNNIGEETKKNSRDKKAVLGIMFIVVSLILFPTIKSFFGGSKAVEETAKAEDRLSVITKDTFKNKVPVAEEPIEKPITKEPIESPPKAPIVVMSKPVEEIKVQKLSKSNPAMMVSSGARETQSLPNYQTTGATTENQDFNQTIAKEQEQGEEFFTAPAFKPMVAKKSPFNPHLLLEQGTLIQCSLRSRLISNIGGQISCVVANDVYSKSGSVILVDKGSRINGFYKGNSVSHGQSQIFAVWQEIRTPNNLIIPINSGSTDELGANGLNGWVDNHFWARFKNAILLSLINDAIGVLASNATKEGRADTTENTREGSRDMAKTVLEQMGDIKPTIYKNQGDTIGILVARDIDFSSVYNLTEQ